MEWINPSIYPLHKLTYEGIINEGFINEEKFVTALLSTEGEARMDNDALKPRLKAEVSMHNGRLPLFELIN
jgi:hypothetical protein